MKPEDIELLKVIFSEVLDERRSIDSETHAKDHRFLHTLMKKEQRRDELIENTKKQVLGWATILLIGFVGYSILEYVKVGIQRVIN